MTDAINIVEESLRRITSLHRDRKNYRAFLTAVLRQLQPLLDAAERMLLWRDISAARGDALYKIAEIVGAPLVYSEELLFVHVGFDEQTYGMPLWDDTNPSIEGGRWREHGEYEHTLDGIFALQRMVIRAQIIKNHSHGYTPEIAQQIVMLFDAPTVFVENNHDMSFDIDVGHMLTQIEIQLVRDFDILARQAGVGMRNFEYWDGTLPVFGFDHQENTYGFDEGYFALLVDRDTEGIDANHSAKLLPAPVGR